jgi:hypothetical protein
MAGKDRGLTMKLAAVAALALGVATAAPAATPTPGARAYRYQVVTRSAGQVQSGYRMDFDLRTGRSGAIDAIVRSAEQTSDGAAWIPVAVSEACRAAMHAPDGGLAQARLWPGERDPARALGPGFLDLCAPDAVFLPLTDILNVAILRVSPQYGVTGLKHAGDRARYGGFTAAFDRGAMAMREVSSGGTASLMARDKDRLVIDWAPDLADLNLQQRKPPGAPTVLQGTEHFAFRVEVDARSGALLRAKSTYDDLDLSVSGPGIPAGKPLHLKMSREVVIEPG